jgi:hypothetical protein
VVEREEEQGERERRTDRTWEDRTEAADGEDDAS